ncbi:MAG: EVE domain-containing protein [Gemmatimonadales bacterium]|nr:EVE domain-containing protein [Gemmatimonadales bacterium]
MAKNYWLLKTESSTYSFDDLLREGKAVWDGISAPAALIHLRAMRKSDEAMIYHSGDEKAIVGTARIVSDPYPDPKLDDPKRVVVEVAPVKRLAKPIPLSAIKADKRFASFPLVRISRLSTMPVTATEWSTLMGMAR